MRHLLLAILFVFIGTSNKISACGNEYGYTLEGKRIYTRYFYLTPRMLHFDTVYINKRLQKLGEKLENGTADYKTWSDIAINIMKIGQADSSLKILRPLLEKHPNEYNIIANIGTAYELTGQLDSALKYISKGLEINATSHRKSEWIHKAILEAKIKEKSQKGWIRRNAIIDIKKLTRRVNANNPRRAVDEINKQFFFQIRTRAPFTPKPNMVLANILMSMGDFNKEVGTYENALLAYIYALEFQGENQGLNKKIKGKIRTLNTLREEQGNINELPPTFLRMMKRSKIDPEILLMGIEDFAIELDSIHQAELMKQDSLELMKIKMDSISVLAKEEMANKEVEIVELESQSIHKYLFLLIGLIIGVGLTFLVTKRKKN